MSIGRAILNAVIEYPDDNLPRLIYADWLEETDDPANADYARFIRAQVALAARRADPGATPRDLAELEEAARTAEQAYSVAWVGERVARLYPWSWDRGFVDRMIISQSAYLRYGPHLHRNTPLQRVSFAGRVPVDLGRFAGRSWFRHLRDVTVRFWCRASGFERFAASPHVRLRHLRVEGGGPDPADIRRVTESGWGPGLETLQIREIPNPMPGTLGEALGAPGLRGLRDLLVGSTRLAPADLAALGAGNDRRPLERLALHGVGLTPDRLRALTDTPLFRRGVARLSLYRNALTDAAVAGLAEAPGVERVVSLDLKHNDFGDAGARALAGSPRVAGLRQLLAWGNRLSPRGQHALRSRFGGRVYVRPRAGWSMDG